MNTDLEFGAGTLTLEVADGRLAGAMEPKPAAPLEDAGKAVDASLEQPLGLPPIGEALEGQESALILTVGRDHLSPRVLLQPILRSCQAAGVKATVCIAHGCRRPMSESDLKDHLGAAFGMVPVVQHDAWSDELCLEFGVTSRGAPIRLNRLVRGFDAVLSVDFVEPSHLLGFAGGKELIAPGVAHHTTIAVLHRGLFHPDAQIGVMYGNPVSDCADEAAAEAPLLWATHGVTNPDGEFVGVTSGRPRRAHLAACRKVRPIYEAQRCGADIVVASVGGSPHDCDLASALQALGPAAQVVGAGGAVVLVAECREGWGPEPALQEWLCGRSPREILEQAPSSAASALGVHGAYLAAGLAEKGIAVILVTAPEMAAALDGSFVRAGADLAEAMRLAEADAGGNASVAVLRHARRLILS